MDQLTFRVCDSKLSTAGLSPLGTLGEVGFQFGSGFILKRRYPDWLIQGMGLDLRLAGQTFGLGAELSGFAYGHQTED
jgi:hypothetical protein